MNLSSFADDLPVRDREIQKEISDRPPPLKRSREE